MMEKGWKWKTIDPELFDKIVMVDNYTVDITLRGPYPYFLETYATSVFIILEHI